MADIVLENRQLRQEIKRLSELEREFHDYIMEEYLNGEQAVKKIIQTPLKNIIHMDAAYNKQ